MSPIESRFSHYYLYHYRHILFFCQRMNRKNILGILRFFRYFVKIRFFFDYRGAESDISGQINGTSIQTLESEEILMSRHGENIRKRKDGRWEARYIQGHDENGKAKYRYIYAKTYTEVKKKRQDAMKEQLYSPVRKADFSDRSFDDMCSRWISDKKQTVKESTYGIYKNLLDTHILPVLGNYPMNQINQDIIQQFLLDKGQNGRLDGTGGLSGKTISDLSSILKQILQYAQQHGFPEMAMIQIKSKGTRTPQIQVLSVPEQKKQVDYLFAHQQPLYLGILLSLYTGIRIGEVCALKWEDFNFENVTVSINKTLLRIQNHSLMDTSSMSHSSAGTSSMSHSSAGTSSTSYSSVDTSSMSRSSADVSSAGHSPGDFPKTRIIIDSPKTLCSIRTIPLPDFLVPYYKNNQKPASCYLLTGMENYMEPRVCLEKYKIVLKKAGIPLYTFHALRHTFATRCVEQGMDIKTLSEIMGHSNVSITMQRYVHPSLEMKREQINRLSNVIISGHEMGQTQQESPHL